MSVKDRFGSYIVCDDAYVAMVGGKFSIQGMYTGELVIPQDGVQISQLIFLIHAYTPKEKPFKKLGAKISFPGRSDPFLYQAQDAMFKTLPPVKSDRTMLSARFPVSIIMPVLTTGKISVVLTHDKGEIELLPTWISSAFSDAGGAIASTASLPQP